MFNNFFNGKRKSFMSFMFAFMLPVVMAIRTLSIGEGSGEAELLEKIESKVNSKVQESLKSMTETIEELKKTIPEKDKFIDSKTIREVTEKASAELKALEDSFGKKLEELKNDETVSSKLEEMNKVLNDHGLEIKKMNERKEAPKTNGVAKDNIKELINKYIGSEDFKTWVNEGMKGSSDKKVLLKDGSLVNADSLSKEDRQKTTSVSTDHTGTVLISETSMNVRDTPIRNLHIRDLMPITQTSSTQIVAPEVYDYTDAITMGMAMLAENDEATDIGFKTRENSWSISRVAAKMPISKRYIKTNGLQWVIDRLIARLPNAIRNKEDYQLLFGDGNGDNVDGFIKDAQQFDLTPTSYTAGAMTAYEAATIITTNDSTKVTFANPHGLRNGDNYQITAGNTDASYLAEHVSIIVEDAYNIVIPVAYVAGETVTNWVASGISTWYQAVQSPQNYDVLVVSKSLLQTGEYMATGYVINPADFDKMGLIKADDNQYVGVARDAYGRITVNGLPIVTATFMPAGQFLAGDFQMAVELAEYTPLTIRAYEDTTDAAKNQITFIIEEEFILPKYNPYWFIYGRFADAITDITAP